MIGRRLVGIRLLKSLVCRLLLVGLCVGTLSTATAQTRVADAPGVMNPAIAPEPAGDAPEPLPSRLVRSGIGLVILGMSFSMMALVVWMGFEYRRGTAIPSTLIHDLEYRLQHQRYVDAYERLLTDRSFLARVLAPGVRKLNQGTPAALRALELANEQVTLEMESRAGYLGTVAALGPMIGLLGTVYGMIVSFGVIARAQDTPQPGDLAAGISTSLVSTLEGIAVAVPAIIFAGIFRARIARLSTEVQIQAEQLLDQFTPQGLAAVRIAPGAEQVPTSTHPLAASALAAAAARASGKLP